MLELLDFYKFVFNIIGSNIGKAGNDFLGNCFLKKNLVIKICIINGFGQTKLTKNKIDSHINHTPF